MSMEATGGSRTDPELTPAHVALGELFAALDAEDWDVVVSHLDEDAELADELTGTWLRGRDAVARYLRAQEGIVTDIVSRPVDVSARPLMGNVWLTTFNFEQRYLLMGERHRERLTGLCVLHVSPEGWKLAVFHLGGSAREAIGLGEDEHVDAAQARATTAEPPATGELIRQRRQELGLSLRAVAERAGLSASLLSQVERGRTDPSVGSLRQIATALSLAVHELAGEVPAPSSKLMLARSRDRHVVNLGFQGITIESFPSRVTPALSAYVRRYSGDEPTGGVDAPSDALLYVLEGAVEVTSAGVASVLASNDAAMVGASTSYELRPLPGRAARVLVVQARLGRRSQATGE